jgi:hypothetical protein
MMTMEWAILQAAGVPTGAARDRVVLDPSRVSEALAAVLDDPVDPVALLAWLSAFAHHWPSAFERILGPTGARAREHLRLQAVPRDRYLSHGDVMVLPLLLACVDHMDARPFPDGDADADADTDADTDTDTDADTDVDTEVCWLGPNRDHGVCTTTIAYDAAAFGADYDYPEPYNGSAQYAVPDRFVDIQALAADLAIAPNFQLDEYLVLSDGRYGILQGHMVDELQALRDDIGGALIVDRGYMSPGFNAREGGIQYSRHLYGDAADMHSSGWTPEEMGALCDAHGASTVDLYEDGHMHCDWRDVPLDPAFWDATRSAARPDVPEPTATIVREGAVLTAPATGFDEGEPFRRWTARDAEGRVIDSATGRSYAPPEDATQVEVTVGGRVTLRQ